MRAAIDTEGDNLHPFLSKLYCCCAVDIDTGEEFTYLDADSLKKAAKEWTLIVGHGLLSYDLWALRKCWGIKFTVGPDTFDNRSVVFVDTLVWSRSLHPDRQPGHSIADWGQKFGLPKIEFNDFSQYSEEMRIYCLRDCEIARRVYKELLQEQER